ncbi:hypothetical protein ABHN11_24645 [Brevibacillus centrosporus]|uniref:hypothetical protein n=1 Tax=Brevibacillus centrosporus TaxID=54910 RepID=UPI003D217FE2
MMEPTGNKDTTLKVSQEQREAVNALVSELSLQSQKDLIDYFFALHRNQQLQDDGQAIPQLSDLKYHFARIEGIYTEFVKAARDRQIQASEEISDQKQQLEQAKIKQFELLTELDTVKKEADERIATIQADMDVVNAAAALTRENAAKDIEQMRVTLQQAMEAKEQANHLVSLAQEAAQSAKDRASQFEEKAEQADKLREERDVALQSIEGMQKDTQEVRVAFEQHKKNAAIEMERVKERAAVELERAVMAAEREHMETVKHLREALAEEREKNAALMVQLAETKEALREKEREQNERSDKKNN